MLDRAVHAHHAESGSLHIWDGETNCLSLIAQSQFDHRLVDRLAHLREGDGAVVHALRRCGEMVVIEDIREDPRSAQLANWLTDSGMRGILSSPLHAKSGSFLGAFSTYYAHPLRLTPEQHDMAILYSARFSQLLAAMLVR
jgi:GAF domain-containing protein